LRTLALRASLKWRPHVKTVLSAVWPSELPVNEHGTPGILAARRLWIRRDNTIGNGFHRAPFVDTEEMPRTRNGLVGRIAGIGRPGQMVDDDGAVRSRKTEQKVGRTGKQFASVKSHSIGFFLAHGNYVTTAKA
jgi:hypothetical protein